MQHRTDAEIRARAYEIWEQEGRPDGRDWDHWLRAAKDLGEPQGEAEPAPKSDSQQRDWSAEPASQTEGEASSPQDIPADSASHNQGYTQH